MKTVCVELNLPTVYLIRFHDPRPHVETNIKLAFREVPPTAPPMHLQRLLEACGFTEVDPPTEENWCEFDHDVFCNCWGIESKCEARNVTQIT